MADVIRVLVADDHAIVRKGLRDLIDAQADMRVVAEAARGAEVLELVASTPVDVLTLDLSFPDVGGLEVLKRLRPIAPRVVVIVLTMYPEDQMAWHITQLGAAAYLNKARPPEELIRAIRAARRQGRYLTAELSQLAFEHQLPATPEAPHHRLTTREYQVFLALIAGKTVNQIADDLTVAASTVSNHVAAIRDKLGAASVTDILRYAHRAGLL